MKAESTGKLALSQLDFGNTAIAFHRISTKRLKQSLHVFQLFQQAWLVKMSPAIASFTVKTGIPLGHLFSRSIFKHFCGGETIAQCIPKMEELAEAGVGTVLDYATEYLTRDEDFEKTCNETLATIDFASRTQHIPFCAFKPTAIARFEVLEKLNAKTQLSKREEDEVHLLKRRLHKIYRSAAEKKIRTLIDAEETWIQDAIDELVLDLMRTYNKESAIVYNTVQMYRHDRLAYLHDLVAKARQQGFKIGVKLVRGAYMEKERKRAEQMGYPSPIHPTKEATDEAYNEALKYCVDNRDVVALFAGTHNERSTHLLAELIDQAGMDRKDRLVEFGQLLGMSDNLTYNLAHFGFNVAKWVPYGRLKNLLPYLARRAQENSSIRGQSSRELQLIRKELDRRKQTPNSGDTLLNSILDTSS